jgi:hypothetical protein
MANRFLETYRSIKKVHQSFNVEYFENLLKHQEENNLTEFHRPIIEQGCKPQS